MKPKLKYLNTYKNRHGHTFVYVRRYRTGGKSIEIKARPINSPEFYTEYSRAIAIQEAKGKPLTSSMNCQDTVNWLYAQYLKSPEWKELKPVSQSGKRGRLNEIMDVVIPNQTLNGQELKFGGLRYASLGRKHILELRKFKYEQGFPAAANNWVKDLAAMFHWAELQQVTDGSFRNPATEIKKIKEGGGHHTWTEEEQRQFEEYWPVGTMQRLAYALMKYCGARVSDAYTLGLTNEANNTLTWKPFKGKEEYQDGEEDENALMVELPIHSELRKAIDASPSGNLVYCATSFGTPFKSEKSFSMWFVKARKKAGLPKACVPHGLRKVAAKNLAEMGATEYQLMSVMGWTKPDMARVYIEKANRGKMAASATHSLDKAQIN